MLTKHNRGMYILYIYIYIYFKILCDNSNFKQ